MEACSLARSLTFLWGVNIMRKSTVVQSATLGVVEQLPSLQRIATQVGHYVNTMLMSTLLLLLTRCKLLGNTCMYLLCVSQNEYINITDSNNW